MNLYNKKYIILLINIFLTAFLSANSSNASDVFRYKLDNTQFLNYNQKRSLSTVNYLLSKYINPNKIKSYDIKIEDINKPKTRDKISITKSSIVFHGDPIIILNNRDSFSYFIISIISNLIENENLEYNNQFYEWITTAIFRRYKLYKAEISVPFRGTFPGIHYLIMSGKKLSPAQIINSNLYTSYSIGYELYAEECEVLLNTIVGMDKGKDIITSYFKSIGNDSITTQPYQLFEKILNNNTDNKNTNSLQTRLFNTAFYYSVNYYMPANTNYCLKQFKKVQLISYIDKKNDNKTQCSLSNLSDNIGKIKNPETVLSDLLLELKNLQSYFPFYMYRPLQALDKLILQLKLNVNKNTSLAESEKLKKDIKEKIKAIYTGAKKQQQLNELLDKTEIETNKTYKLFMKYYTVINKNNKIEKSFWPKLNNYLDKMNSQFY